jgi:hypothetical protein
MNALCIEGGRNVMCRIHESMYLPSSFCVAVWDLKYEGGNPGTLPGT